MPLHISELSPIEINDILNVGRIKSNVDKEKIRLYINSLEDRLNSLSADSIKKRVAQPNHGFIVGNIIRFNGSGYLKAFGDTEEGVQSVGMVTEVIDADNFVFTISGYVDGLINFIDFEGNPIQKNNLYFLSNATSVNDRGKITKTSNHRFYKPVFLSLTNSSGIVMNTPYRTPSEVSDPILSFSFTNTGSGYFVAPEQMTLKLENESSSKSVTKTFEKKSTGSTTFSTITLSNNAFSLMKGDVFKFTLLEDATWDEASDFYTVSFLRID